MRPCSCMKASARAQPAQRRRRWTQVRLEWRARRKLYREPPSQSSMTRQSAGGTTHSPYRRTTFGWRRRARSLASSQNAAMRSASSSTQNISFTATLSPRYAPRNTRAVPPAPNTCWWAPSERKPKLMMRTRFACMSSNPSFIAATEAGPHWLPSSGCTMSDRTAAAGTMPCQYRLSFTKARYTTSGWMSVKKTAVLMARMQLPPSVDWSIMM
mmetsp:Transcript_6156/g.19620  ORF Transcript_6156/g.19620 Transcript_6156/m.19620 type:complete len:213 (-) Transcript_6156:661-1299(-)